MTHIYRDHHWPHVPNSYPGTKNVQHNNRNVLLLRGYSKFFVINFKEIV